MSNYVVAGDKCFVDIDTIAIGVVSNVDGSFPLTRLIPTLHDGVSTYVLTTCDDGIYPVEIASTDITKAAIVTITKFTNPSANVSMIASVKFEYEGVVYVSMYRDISTQGASLTPWAQLATESEINTITTQISHMSDDIEALDDRVSVLEHG